MDDFKNLLTLAQKNTLASIVKVGDDVFRELEKQLMLNHPYFDDGTKARIRTKLMHIQFELESRDPSFPFTFTQRHFSFGLCVPELQTESLILHIAKSKSQDILPYESGYKKELSHNNYLLDRQLKLDLKNDPPVKDVPFYGLLTFGGRRKLEYATILFPAPGYIGIADSLSLPVVHTGNMMPDVEIFERKKAGLKKEYLAQEVKEEIS